MMSKTTSEKAAGDVIEPAARSSSSIEAGKVAAAHDDSFEVFKKEEGQVDFRTVGWVHAAVIFLKRESFLSSGSLALTIT